MKTTKLLWGILTCVLLSFAASCAEEEKEPPVDGTVTDENGPITLELADITATTALFKGSVNLNLYSKYDEVGIIYSLTEDLEIKPLVTNVVPITNIDKNNCFEKKMRELLYNTKYYYSSYVCMNGIYKFGEVQSFTTNDVRIEVSAPTVTSTTATFKGKVTVKEDDLESLSFGVAWSANSNFENGVNEEEVGLEDDGSFVQTVDGLKMGKEYFYAPYISQLDSKYGDRKKFVTTAASMRVSASQITQTSVTFTGKAEKNSADESIEYGILYSTDSKLEVGASGCVRKVLTEVMSTNGNYSLKVDGLVNDTKYYYCWYARQGSDYKYGPSQEFSTTSITVNISVNPITQTTATFTGSYTRLDGEDIEVGLLYSTSSSGLTADSNNATKIKMSNKDFTHKVEGLKYNTSYYYCSYICQNGKYKYGPVESFKTKDVIVEVSASDITVTSVTFSGKTEIIDSDVIEVGILYSTSSSLSPTSSSTNKKVLSNGDFSFTAQDLKNNTKYYYKYFIKYAGSYAYGERHNFTTSSITATLSGPSVTQTTATFSGNVNIEDISLIQFGILYSTSSSLSATSSNIKKIPVTSLNDGAFSCKAEGLTHSTKYYYCYYACQDGSYTYGKTESFTTSSVNISLSVGSVAPTTAVFNGNVELTEEGLIEVGVLYSTGTTLTVGASSVTKQVLTPDLSGSVSFKAEGLQFATTYNYCYYVCQNGKYIYGEKQIFTTSSVNMDLSVDSVTQTTATFKGNVELTEDGLIEVGVLYSTGTTLTVGASGVTKQVLTPDSSGSVSFKAEGLLMAVTYNYCYYVCQNGKYTYGTPQALTTSDFPWDYSAEDLSIDKTANCYIVSKSGLYKVRAVKGNSNTSVTGDYAEVLWESFGTSVVPSVGDLVQYVSYKDGYIGFKIHDDFKEGNAVIAAKDADGNILWSWHIWFTDQPQGQTYYNNAGTMMDRNLGATSATPGDVGALGLLYQWGRKDPFLGSSSISSSSLAMSTITWPSTVKSNSSNGTIEYATAHPTTFITYNSINDDWYYTGSSSTDNTRWTTSDKTKSIYDPCPAGWRVPDGDSNGVWSKALGSSSYSFDYTYNSTNEGMNFSGMFGSASTIWYPASGSRSRTDGGLYSVGDYGSYWSASPASNYAFPMYFRNNGNVYPATPGARAGGDSVRCLQE